MESRAPPIFSAIASICFGKAGEVRCRATRHSPRCWIGATICSRTRDRQVLCSLSVLVGDFTLEAAQAITDDAVWSPLDVALAVGSLVDKSLIWTAGVDGSTRFRLLDTTRGYASAKLADSGEQNAAARRHALYFCKRP